MAGGINRPPREDTAANLGGPHALSKHVPVSWLPRRAALLTGLLLRI